MPSTSSPSRIFGTAGLLACSVCVLAGGLCLPAQANDRPFQAARTAVLEDEENVWSMESWIQRYGSTGGLSVEPEYTFLDGFSVQVELTRLQDHRSEQSGHEAEVELKQVFNNIAKDGWGYGLSLKLGVSRSQEEGAGRSQALRLPLSFAFDGDRGYVHLNAGIEKENNVRRQWTSAAAIEYEVRPATHLFVEAAHEGLQRFAQIGVRHWLRRERLAIDLAIQRLRGPGPSGAGLILGLGWYTN